MARPRSLPPNSRSQQGAVLYVALIMLLLMAMLGVAGMQVAGLQEKMAANYRDANLAFQNAETSVRVSECFLDDRVNRRTTPGCTPAAATVEEICDTGFDATNWAKGRAMSDAPASSVNMRSIGRCISGQASLGMGREAERGGDPNPVYQITAYATDVATNPAADAAIDTIFMP